MKTIKFQKLTVLKMAIPLGIAIALLFLSFFEVIENDPSKLNKILIAFGYLILTLHFAQMFWYTNYVSYNNKAVTIRLGRNVLKERSFQFKHLKQVGKEGTIISLIYRNKEEQIDLKGFDNVSQQNLFNILKNT